MAIEIRAAHTHIRHHRIFAVKIDPLLEVDSSTLAVASITEINIRDEPFEGKANMKIYNVIPEDQAIVVRGEIDFDADLDARVTVFYAVVVHPD